MSDPFTTESIEQRINKLQSQLRIQKIFSYSVLFLLCILMISSFSGKKDPEIIRASGIVIVDSQGRERILIGAPVPLAMNRVRTDTNRVKETWAKRFPSASQFMRYYKDYNHSSNGILILDENGYDRIAIGSPTPDPNIGKRIGPATGFEINDENGFERTGYGVLNVKDKNRVVLALDGEDGREGAYLIILPDGTTGLGITHKKKSIYLGNANKNNLMTDLDKDFFGLLVKDSLPVYNFNLLNRARK